MPSKRPPRPPCNGRLEIAPTVRAHMLACAAEGYPQEACGILVGRSDGEARVVERLIPTANRWSERHDRYLVDPQSVRRALAGEDAGGPHVLGFYHSHPDGPPVPTGCDRMLAWRWYYYVIVEVAAGRSARARAWQLDPLGSQFTERPIVGR